MLLGEDIVLRLDRINSANVARHGGEDALLYKIEASGAAFLGVGRPRRLTFGAGEGELVTCEVREVRPFGYPVGTGFHGSWKVGAVEVSDEEFADVVQRGGRIDIGSVQESGAYIGTGIEHLEPINRLVLERWDYTCAVTGERYPYATGFHDELEIVAIRPLSQGGPQHVRNCLPMVAAAANAWRRGDISATQNHELIVVERYVDVDLLERMRPSRMLFVPDDAELGPDPEHLAYHRQHVFGARRG
jgi:hypothetical protein